MTKDFIAVLGAAVLVTMLIWDSTKLHPSRWLSPKGRASRCWIAPFRVAPVLDLLAAEHIHSRPLQCA
jgi:hypothetical protein